MIDPDLININIIPDSKLTMIQIENVAKIRKQNSYLKQTFIVLVIITFSIVIQYKFNTRDKNSIEE